MSGECYKEPGDKPSPSDRSQMDQLIEYESMVHTAEDKCSQLKGQLDRIKQLYADQSHLIKTSAADPPAPRKFTTDLSRLPRAARLPPRQVARHIETDTSGASIGTINNILAGITKTIEMPTLFHRIKNLSSKTSQEIKERSVAGVENVKIHEKTLKSALKAKPRKTKRTASKLTVKSSAMFSKSYHNKSKGKSLMDKRSCEEPRRRPGIPLINMNSRRILKRAKAQNRLHSGPHDLVEIYHNVAVQESKSSEADVAAKKCASLQEKGTMAASRVEIPPLNIRQDEEGEEQEEEEEEEDAEARVDVHQYAGNVYGAACQQMAHTYTQPTVASRMKKVAKYYMNSFNIKCIPFCTATSVGPSHNIGLNIQQVMSMVKNRQSTMKLSPTLAYNISLAAGRWQANRADPLNGFIESITSRIFTGNPCPLTKPMSALNFQHMQEEAKTFPERIAEEDEEVDVVDDEAVDPDTQSMIITGPSGDVKVNNRKQTVWSATDTKKCTCVPQKGVEFQKIINKFNNGTKSKTNTVPVKHEGNKQPMMKNEKKLKEMLKKLYDEFEGMTSKYDELKEKTDAGSADEVALKELEELDDQCQQKEEEIVMVMSLYKEVTALKDQVKSLKEKTSTVSVPNIQERPIASNNGDSTATANLLNKLLKQVQHFQTHYKSDNKTTSN